MKLKIQTDFVDASCEIHVMVENVYAETHEMVQVWNCGASLGMNFEFLFSFIFLKSVIKVYVHIHSSFDKLWFHQIKLCVCIFISVPLTHYNLKACFWRERNPKSAWKQLSTNRNVKSTWGQTLVAVSTMDVGCLPPSSSDLRKAGVGAPRQKLF